MFEILIEFHIYIVKIWPDVAWPLLKNIYIIDINTLYAIIQRGIMHHHSNIYENLVMIISTICVENVTFYITFHESGTPFLPSCVLLLFGTN